MASKPQRTENSTESAAEWVSVGELHPWEENPRRNDGEPVRKVVASIKRYGFGAPIVARRANGEIIAGHTRYKAALELGLEKVPVRFLDLEEQEAHMLALADNRTSEEAKWDDVLLAQILAAAKADDVDLVEATGFSNAQISCFLAEEQQAIAPDDFKDFDESIGTDYQCPKCGYAWSGKPGSE